MSYNNKGADKRSEAILYSGANISQLCELFRVDNRTVKRKLHDVPPDGKRSGADVWLVHTAAPHLVKPGYDIEQYIRRMNHAELPAMLTKEFWAGQNAKLTYLEKEGELWATDDVIDALNELMRLFRMSAILLPDQLEKVTTLSAQQRELVNEQIDGMLRETQATILRIFGKRAKKHDAKPIENQEPDDEFPDL